MSSERAHITLLQAEYPGSLDQQLGDRHDDDLEGKQAVLILYYLFEDASCTTLLPCPSSIAVQLTTCLAAGFSRFGKKGIPMKTLALCISLVLNVTVVVSTASLCAETMKKYSSNPHLNPQGWETQQTWSRFIEIISVTIFTVDLTVRGVCSALSHLPEGPLATSQNSPWSTFTKDYMNWIDLLAILPFYINFLVDNAPDLRFLRVVRLARILKIMEAAGYDSVGKK